MTDNQGLPSSDYNPYLYRDMTNAMTNLEALISVIKCAVGTGALAMPLAFYNAGYINGLIGVAILSVIVLYALHILIRGMYELEKRELIPVLTYSEAMELVMQEGPPSMQFFSTWFRYIVDFFLATYHFGIMCVYVVFIAISCKQVADYYEEALDARIYMLMFSTPFVLMYMIRDLKHLVPFSLVANILLLIGFGVIFYEIFKDDLPSLEERNAFQVLSKYPLFFGTVLFSIESVGVVIAIEAEMKTPQDYLGFFGILNQGMIVVFVLYSFIGFFGYWRYGDAIEGSITLNMDQTALLSQICKILFAVAIFFTYGLQGYVAIQVLFYHFIGVHCKKENQYTAELITRAVIAILSVLFAIAMPRLDLFLSFVGSFCLSLLGLVFPGIFDLCNKHHTGYGKCYIYVFRDILLILFGIVGGVLGTWMTVSDIIIAYENGNISNKRVN